MGRKARQLSRFPIFDLAIILSPLGAIPHINTNAHCVSRPAPCGSPKTCRMGQTTAPQFLSGANALISGGPIRTVRVLFY